MGPRRARAVHDVDFVLLADDVPHALQVLDAAGLQVVEPPEDWLVKVYDGDALVDLIFRPAERPVTREQLDAADEVRVDSVLMPVQSATDLRPPSCWCSTSTTATSGVCSRTSARCASRSTGRRCTAWSSTTRSPATSSRCATSWDRRGVLSPANSFTADRACRPAGSSRPPAPCRRRR